MKIGLFAHGGSGNHGCEALVRSTIHLLGTNDYSLFSEKPEEDACYGLDRIARIVPTQNSLPRGFEYLLYAMEMKCRRNDLVYWRWVYRGFNDKIKGLDIALAIGGDNYCYNGFADRFSVLDQGFLNNNIPIILWGCSIDENRLTPATVAILRQYHIIFARESLTYKALKLMGLERVRLIPDPAFLLNYHSPVLPNGFMLGNMVGLNVSPLIIHQEPEPGCVLHNCRQLINYVLQETKMGVVLIPHVIWPDNDDRLPLSELYEEYASSGRVLMIGDNDAPTIKGIIRQCRFLLAARTHASIAGYSTGVPTVVMGYSVKSQGIAKDLFGTADRYVLPISRMTGGDELTEAFKWLVANEDTIRTLYDSRMKDYLSGFNLSILDGVL